MKKDLTTGSPMKLIIGFALPLMVGLVLQQLYSMVDTMIVGKMLGTESLAAVGASGSINFLVMGFCIGLCSGFSIPMSQCVGARNERGLRRYVSNSIYVGTAFAIVLTAITVIFCENFMHAMKTPSDIFDEACAYIRIIFAGIPVTILYNTLAGIISSLGDSKTPVFFLGIASVLNVILYIAFIAILKTDASGTALATVIAQGISGLACLFYVMKKFPMLKIRGNEWRFNIRYVKKLCAMGVPMGLQYSVTAIGAMVLQTSVNSLGVIYVSAKATAEKIQNIIVCPFSALGTTMATYGGQNVGAWKLDRLGKGLKSVGFLGLIYSIIALIIMLLFSSKLSLLFVDSSNTELISLMSQFLITQAAFYFMLSLVNSIRFLIQGMGFNAFSVFSGVFELIARGLFGAVLVPMFGYTAVCFANPVAWIAAVLFLVPAYFRCVRKLKTRD